ncbi:MAG: hypothetical protein ACYSUF_13930 [Planctomycetota bacterium]|jgi:hypothetical protein
MAKLDESKRASVRASDLLAAAAALAAGTQAYGEVIIFINPAEGEPGHFDWNWIGGFPGTPEQWLDITRPSTDQGGGIGPTSIGQVSTGGCEDADCYYNGTINGAAVASSSYPGTTALLAGATIEGQLYFWANTYHAIYIIPYRGDPYFASNFPDGVVRYMGVRFSDTDGYHYGWISVVHHGNDFNGLDFDAFAWGYESEPGVPIIAGIPAPGTLAALAFGAVVTRRKRED